MKKPIYCEGCGGRMRRNGRTRAGTERYRCMGCKISTTIHRPDLHRLHDRKRFIRWLTGAQNKEDIAQRYGVSRRALTKEFKPFFRESSLCPIPEKFQARMLIVDGKYIHKRQLCVLTALTEEDRIFWWFADEERYGTWYGFLIHFAAPDVVVADGQKGMNSFVKKWWPHTLFQRCHFHFIQNVIECTTRDPKDATGKEIFSLACQLPEIKTEEEKKRWLQFHFLWEKQYEKVFSEKTDAGGFKYRKLRKVRGMFRRAIPDLFTYLDIPGCPNTTNDVEGWINRSLDEHLGRHRGLRPLQKKTLVSVVLSNLKRKPKGKNTRKFP